MSENIYCDRFIPSRLTSNLEEAMGIERSEKCDNDGSFTSYLKNELFSESSFGSDALLKGQNRNFVCKSPSSPSIFRYQQKKFDFYDMNNENKMHDPTMRSEVANFDTTPSPRLASSIAGSPISGCANYIPTTLFEFPGQLSLRLTGSPFSNRKYDTVSSKSRSIATEWPEKYSRRMSSVPFKMLDAVSLQDDFYLNLLDWSSQNVVAVGLGSRVFLWSGYTSKVSLLCDLGGNQTVSSVGWSGEGEHLAIGTSQGSIQIWDPRSLVAVKHSSFHSGRVGAVAWNGTLLASGSKDRTVAIQDTRIRSTHRGSRTVVTRKHSSDAITDSDSLDISDIMYSESIYGSEDAHEFVQKSPSIAYDCDVGHSCDSNDVCDSAMDETESSSSFIPFPSFDNHQVESATDETVRLWDVDGRQPHEAAGYGRPASPWLETPTRPPLVPTIPRTERTRPLPIEYSAERVRRRLFSTKIQVDGCSEFDDENCGVSLVHRLLSHKQEVCGVKWSPSGDFLATGGNDNKLCIWDLAACNRVSVQKSKRTMGSPLRSPLSAVSSVSSTPSGLRVNGSLRYPADAHLDFGSPVRNSNEAYESSSDVESGSTLSPLFKFHDHCAAIKALAWSPYQTGLLASGGGTADRHIRFWDIRTGNCLQAVDTGSQVCNLAWSPVVNEIVSTHGYSLNQVIVWKYPSMQKVSVLAGHTSRVIYLSVSPNGQDIVTGAGDETLKFWHAFPHEGVSKSESPNGVIRHHNHLYELNQHSDGFARGPRVSSVLTPSCSSIR